jgi:hypothetical protein
MTEPRQSLGLAGEAFGEGRVVPDTGRQNLEGDDPVQFLLARLIDRAHAAPANQAEQVELGEQGP